MELYRLKLALVVIGSDSGSETSSPPVSGRNVLPIRGNIKATEKPARLGRRKMRQVPQFSLVYWKYLWHYSGQWKLTENDHTLALDLY